MLTMYEPNKKRPYTVVTFFEDCAYGNKLYHQFTARQNVSKKHCTKECLLMVRENLQGNIFNRPFKYILLKKCDEEETKPTLDSNPDKRPIQDYFVTQEKIVSRLPHNKEPVCSTEMETYVGTEERRYVILAYKTLEDNSNLGLETSWKQWTGATELVAGLSTMYKISNVQFLKGLSITPCAFQYIVVVEIFMDQKLKQTDNYALDFLQKFRIKRMSGYLALYVPVS